MATTEETINALQARILELESQLTDLKTRPQTPDNSAELRAIKEDLTGLRQELSEMKKFKAKKSQTPEASEEGGSDVELGHFGGD